MEGTDYRKLCIELFGTDDEEQLRMIAKKNNRNAGRKQKFTEQDVSKMRELSGSGVKIQEIAKQYHTTRQTVSRYLNAPMPDNCTVRMTYCYHQYPCTIIDVDFLNEKVKIQNRTDDVLRRAFGINQDPTWKDFCGFLEERCFPRSRGLVKEKLKELGLSSYDPLQIVEKTQGRMAEDDMWLKIQYRPLEGW